MYAICSSILCLHSQYLQLFIRLSCQLHQVVLLYVCFFSIEIFENYLHYFQVGKGDSGKSAGPRSTGSGAGVRQRKSTAPARSRPGAGGGGASAGVWRFYTEDSPGLKVGPVPVLVMSLIFIASVFMLHIWGKYTK